jgi:mannose/fructose/N-acetylgalactosamine-specific phosphotransferase system component IIC
MIHQETYNLLLNGMPFEKFIVYFIFGFLGIAIFYLTNVYNGMKNNQGTPKHFSWFFFWKGTIRMILSLITLSLVIIFFKDIAPFLLNTSENIPVELNGFSSLLIGTGIDGAWNMLIGIGKTKFK